MTFVLTIGNVIFLIWIVAGIADRPSRNCPPGPNHQLCIGASDVGTGIGVGLVLVLWFIGFIVLSIVWFMTRRRGRICPHCGEDVKKGRIDCRKCGYDFTTGTNPNLPAPAAQ
jgi:hypothetical protein